MKEEQCEGIVLRSIEYKEKERILTLFTKEKGVLSCIVKGISQKKYHLLAQTSLFCQSEFTLRKNNSDLYFFIEAKIMEEHLFLRTEYNHLRIAGEFAKAVSLSQLPGKSSPLLYALLLSFMKQIPNFSNPYPLISSYYLKILHHEGLQVGQKSCSVCEMQPALFLYKGENFCKYHTHSSAHYFSKAEWDLIEKLSTTRQYETLKTLDISETLQKKIEDYFRDMIHG